MVSLIDITDRRREEKLQLARNEVLEQLAHGKPLNNLLVTLVRSIEEAWPEVVASVLLLDQETRGLRYGAAPAFPHFTTMQSTVSKSAPASARAALLPIQARS